MCISGKAGFYKEWTSPENLKKKLIIAVAGHEKLGWFFQTIILIYHPVKQNPKKTHPLLLPAPAEEGADPADPALAWRF